MAVTSNTYTVGGSGQAGPYSYGFPILADTDIAVSVNGVVKSVTTHYTVDSGNTRITFVSGQEPSTGDKVIVYRDTDEDPIKSVFASGSTLRSNELNDNFNQLLYIVQENDNQSMSTLGGVMQGNLGLGLKNNLYFEGATDDAYETTLTVVDPTADRTITLPNVTGTVVTTGDTGTVTSAMINDATIVNGDIANTTITGGKLVNDTITATQIAANAITASELADDAVDRDAIVNDAVNGTKIADDSIDSEHITDGSVDLAHLSANSVDSSKIVDDSIVNADINSAAAIAHSKLANVTSGQILVGNGSNVPTAVAVSGDVTLSNSGAVTIGNDKIDSQHYVDGSIDNAHIGSQQVGHDKIAPITSSDHRVLGRDHESNGAISEIQISRDHIVDGEIIVTKLATNAVTNEKIDNNAVSTLEIADNAVTIAKIADAELTTLAGMQSGTASILADSTALTSTTAELNLLDGKSIVTTISNPTDVQIPTAQAVEERIESLVTDVGGFRPIANETSFPATNPDPEDNAGTIVSVKALASNLTSNGSGVATIANGAGSGNTVTINGMANSDTIEAGKGILVETTSTLHTYTFHRETLAPADVTAAKSAVDDFNQRYQVAGSTPTQQPDGTALAEGDLFFDTAANKMKVYDGSNYGEVTSTGDYKYLFLCPDGGSGAPTLSNTSFDLREGSNSGSLASVTNAAQLIVSVNGVIQKANTGTSAPAEGFAMADGNNIKFGGAPGVGSSIFIVQIGSAVSIPTPGDNTVSTIKIQNLAVETGKIADQAVDLTKLPHGDGSSNGKFLRSNNGADPTWETVSTTPEGTAILSTGESGGTKYLREDGDGTSSWQTVSQYTTPLTTRGDILYRAASADARLAKGTEGHYLKMGANDPEWAAVVGAVANGCIFENDLTISDDYTIAATKGAHSVGPITVNSTVTVNGNWVIS